MLVDMDMNKKMLCNLLSENDEVIDICVRDGE